MKSVTGILSITSLAALSLSAIAQQPADDVSTGGGGDDGLDEVVVTGFRGSLADALAVKRAETGIVDVIKAEDVAKFPDANLAESLQRLPGVAVARDGGEGRSISVRGLGHEWSVLCNGGRQEVIAQAATLGAQVVEQRCPTLDEIFVARAARKQGVN